jgi:ketosteroid isomerase-like protein
VKRCYAASAEGPIQQGLQLFAEDLDFQHPMPLSIRPWAEMRSGRQRLEQFCADSARPSRFEQFEPRELIAQDQYVVVTLFERGRIKTTVVALDNPYVHVLKFAEGKVAQIRIFEDTARINAALQGYPK